MSGWGKPGGLAAVMAAPNAQQQQAQLEAEAKRKVEEAARALRLRAEALRNKVEECIKTGGGISGNYVQDDQYTAPGYWTTNETTMAFDLWKQLYEAKAPGSVVSLQIHMMGPSAKYTGGRNGAIQANFIRLKQTGKAGRYNVHIDVRD
ncbi:hypothetical protein [Neoroseomonas oryzicola]|uniref:Uncharacterized protein n=1 Tax=Neoroseomonas oryzicola TaxID=535904 RepID=A0A9X9WDQ0_9PROT|nr:hypothetical protein [Neoroseomonas oryzicola]MBR0658460.1 hypothetical protein [Neoroseomonas oryzicola]NKE17649.1 hypothetical protein [Neoroseomonas oryzicola]